MTFDASERLDIGLLALFLNWQNRSNIVRSIYLVRSLILGMYLLKSRLLPADALLTDPCAKKALAPNPQKHQINYSSCITSDIKYISLNKKDTVDT